MQKLNLLQKWNLVKFTTVFRHDPFKKNKKIKKTDKATSVILWINASAPTSQKTTCIETQTT